MTKLVIFDLDGTLLNTIEDLGTACNHALEQCGFPRHEMSEYNMMVGRGIINLFLNALPQGMKTMDNALRMKEFFVPYYNMHGTEKTRPYLGICEMLEKITSEGIAVAVASNKYQEGTENLVGHYFNGIRFSRILGQRDGHPIKPDSGIVTEAMDSVPGISTDEVVYCGDSDVDMLTGANAGVRTIGVTWGFRTREELAGHKPWMIADSPQEIIDAVIGKKN